MQSSQTLFYTRHGKTIIPANNSIVRPRRGVFAVVIADRHALFVEPGFAKGMLQLPGGGMETGESVDEALAREWREEVGLPFTVKGPLKEYNHHRGFYAEDYNEFWLYDQTFRLYDYTGAVEKDKSWLNSEKDTVRWIALSNLDSTLVYNAHWLGMKALLSNEIT